MKEKDKKNELRVLNCFNLTSRERTQSITVYQGESIRKRRRKKDKKTCICEIKRSAFEDKIEPRWVQRV